MCIYKIQYDFYLKLNHHNTVIKESCTVDEERLKLYDAYLPPIGKKTLVLAVIKTNGSQQG